MTKDAVTVSHSPILFTKEGQVFANSRDVAEFFAKRHKVVLEAIDNLIANEPDLGRQNFRPPPHVDPSNGRTYRSFDMDRRAFSVLAMGFTGVRALRWKLRFMDAFEAMEDELKNRPQPIDLNDPHSLRTALLGYSEKVIALTAEVDEMRPQVAALERLANTDGSMCVTDAAKNLQIHPKVLFEFLRCNGWVYRRHGATRDSAYQSKLAAGLLEHKMISIPLNDGTEMSTTQVRVTRKGLARLGREFPPVVQRVA
ncbi:Rha family transcriptional regulator [Aurantimonas coralicida]|uniref:Rha family transcriptional regulator n=1 Tax=Aurantimonas coralicida TaxID=182270 RepID=UPI001D1906D2|nr:phage regulatory protein/antirepressor Ant [Aurantimonas coralicida]MCC4298147.1 phage regulatory protein/antirepressor Ant [Aurantimonas coralicida]